MWPNDRQWNNVASRAAVCIISNTAVWIQAQIIASLTGSTAGMPLFPQPAVGLVWHDTTSKSSACLNSHKTNKGNQCYGMMMHGATHSQRVNTLYTPIESKQQLIAFKQLIKPCPSTTLSAIKHRPVHVGFVVNKVAL